MTTETPFSATSGWLTLPTARLESRVWKVGGVTVARLTGPGSAGWALPKLAFSAAMSAQECALRVFGQSLLMTAACTGLTWPLAIAG